MKTQNHKRFINKFGICEYMELLDEVKDFWHGNYNFDEKYSLAMENVYLSTCHPPINFYNKAIKGSKCNWDISECEIYAQYVDINKWKNLNWDEISSIIEKYDMVDILVELLREQILIFYKSGLLESDTFKEIIVQYIKNFDDLIIENTKEDFTNIYINGFCQVANHIYENDLISAKNEFIDFATKLVEKANKAENLQKHTLVKSLVKEISERR